MICTQLHDTDLPNKKDFFYNLQAVHGVLYE